MTAFALFASHSGFEVPFFKKGEKHDKLKLKYGSTGDEVIPLKRTKLDFAAIFIFQIITQNRYYELLTSSAIFFTFTFLFAQREERQKSFARNLN